MSAVAGRIAPISDRILPYVQRRDSIAGAMTSTMLSETLFRVFGLSPLRNETAIARGFTGIATHWVRLLVTRDCVIKRLMAVVALWSSRKS